MTVKKANLTRANRGSKQARAQVTRSKILKMASRCLVEDGIQSLRYAQIAKRAKVPQALMGYHFPNIDALLIEMVQLELIKLKDLSVERVERNASNPKKALISYIKAPFDLAATDLEFRATWSAFYHLATVNENFAKLNASIRETGRDRIMNLLTMVLATEGYLTGNNLMSREKLIELATVVQGIITGLCMISATATKNEFKQIGELAVKSSLQALGIDDR